MHTNAQPRNLLAAYIGRMPNQAPALPAPAPYSQFDQLTDAMGLEIGEPIRHGGDVPIIDAHFGIN